MQIKVVYFDDQKLYYSEKVLNALMNNLLCKCLLLCLWWYSKLKAFSLHCELKYNVGMLLMNTYFIEIFNHWDECVSHQRLFSQMHFPEIPSVRIVMVAGVVIVHRYKVAHIQP